MSGKPSIVFCHGIWADGSCFSKLIPPLRAEGYEVISAQYNLDSAQSDIDSVMRTLARVSSPAILVGHSYGGAVISEAGNHPNVAALAYIAAYVPDQGESLGSLIAEAPADAPAPPILPPQGGFLFLDRDKFAAAFAADVPGKLAAFMADSQVGFGVDALSGAVSEPAWRTKPSWYLVTTDDHMIPPPAQRAMSERAKATVTETSASHAVYVSQPAVVAAVIAQAAQGY
jgi:pimeloyl-ACP methyl ester carboxylesterase